LKIAGYFAEIQMWADAAGIVNPPDNQPSRLATIAPAIPTN
jgi:hypothetical protein